MSSRRLAGMTLALLVCAGAALPAHATAVMSGSTSASSFLETLYPGCSGYCAAFFAAGCPSAMAATEGQTASIVDVTSFAGQNLTFGWSSSSTDAYDRLHADAREFTPQLGRMMFYVAAACVQPQFFSFALESTAAGRERAWTIPQGTKWLIAQAAETTVNNVWWASAS